MGLNFILPLIAGIVMTVILGSQVVPNLVENMKIKKVENRTISNQNLIKDAIVKYIKLEGKAPTSLNDLKNLILMENQHNNNLFNGDYTYELVKLPNGRYNGTLKIFTTINDESASKYFSNSLKFPNKPICTKSGSNYNCETFYQLDMEVFDIFAKLEKEKEKQQLLYIYNNQSSVLSLSTGSKLYGTDSFFQVKLYKVTISSVDTHIVVNLLKRVFPNYPMPTYTLSNNDLNFTSDWFVFGKNTIFPNSGPNFHTLIRNAIEEHLKKELGL